MKHFSNSFREYATNVINFEKKIATVNKKRAKTASICSNMLHFQKKVLKKV